MMLENTQPPLLGQSEPPTPITDAVESQLSTTDLSTATWRRWRASADAIYAQAGKYPGDDDVRIGTMATERLAEEAAAAHNSVLERVQRPDFFGPQEAAT